MQNDTILLKLKGDILYEQYHEKECISCYENCLRLYEKKERVTNDEKLNIAEINMKIGNVYKNKGEYPKALEYYEWCL